MRMNREVRQVFDRLGLEVVRSRPGGKHQKVTLRAPDGRETETIVHGSSGALDPRATLNLRASLRRWLRTGSAQ